MGSTVTATEGFFNLIVQRQSVRKFSNRKVEPEKIEQCIEAARLAPSASNAQPWTFVVVDEPSLLDKVAKATHGPLVSFNKFVHKASFLTILVIEKQRLKTKLAAFFKRRSYKLTDHGIAASYFCLMATELGIGTCTLGWFNERKIKRLLGIPLKKRLSLVIAAGYPEENYPLKEKIRKPIEEVATLNHYHIPYKR